MPLLVAAPDKFRGTATAHEVSAAIARAAGATGWTVRQAPLSDGGEGLLDALSGTGSARETLVVEGPLGDPVTATWLSRGPLAVIEMAQASGLLLVGGPGGNDPWTASTRGTGSLMVEAARALSRRTDDRARPATLVVGLGGSATTDGGSGAVDVIEEAGGLDGSIELIGACDVDVGFVAAARRFGPQKGADPSMVAALERRLEDTADRYRRRYGVDVREVRGSGAAGGFGGAIVALGGRLRSGYEVVGEVVGLPGLLSEARTVVTGEGTFDATSMMGKVVGSVLRDASTLGLPALVVAGQATPEAVAEAEALGARVVSLTDRFGGERAMADTVRCLEIAVAENLGPDGPTPG